MAEQTALFGIVVGIALLLSGFGFAILAVGGALRNADRTVTFGKRDPKPARLRSRWRKHPRISPTDVGRPSGRPAVVDLRDS